MTVLAWDRPAARAVAATTTADPVARIVVCLPVLAVTVFSRFGIPIGASYQLSLGLVLLGLAFGLGVVSGRLILRPGNFAAWLLAMAALLGTQLFVDAGFSLTSIGLLAVLHLLYAFRADPARIDGAVAIGFFQDVMAVTAVLGIAQFLGQFPLGVERVFFIDYLLPEKFVLAGYNPVIPLSYGASIFKSNGLYMVEPSVFCQFLSVSAAIEILTRKRHVRLALLAAGMLFSYSGTGLILLAIIAPAILIGRGHYGLLAAVLLAAVLAGLTLALFKSSGGLLNLDLYASRAGEFGSTETSGFARFVSIFYLIGDFQLKHPLDLLVGLGAGSIEKLMALASYTAHEPSWGKLFVEYGVLGFLAYFGFLFFCLFSAGAPAVIAAALAFMFLFLGGYVLIPNWHGLALTLLVWNPFPRGGGGMPFPRGSGGRPFPRGSGGRQ